MEKRKTQEEKQDKNIAETRDYLLFIIQSFWMRVSGKCKKRDKTFCAETRDYSELMPMSSPDLNQGPSDLQSDALPTELSRQLTFTERKYNPSSIYDIPYIICCLLL